MLHRSALYPPTVHGKACAQESDTIVGRTLAYTRVTFYTPDDKVVAYGSHTKHMAKSKQVTAFSKDGQEEIPLDPAQAKL
jgi:acyl-coenzyme A thioesterase 13